MMGIGAAIRSAWDRRSKRRTAECVAQALNARDYDALGDLVTEDLVYLDTMSNEIRGRAAFVAANLRMHDDAPDMTILLDSFSEAGDALLIRGRTTSANPKFCSDTLWHARFARRKMCELQAFRENNAISLSEYAVRAPASSGGDNR